MGVIDYLVIAVIVLGLLYSVISKITKDVASRPVMNKNGNKINPIMPKDKEGTYPIEPITVELLCGTLYTIERISHIASADIILKVNGRKEELTSEAIEFLSQDREEVEELLEDELEDNLKDFVSQMSEQEVIRDADGFAQRAADNAFRAMEAKGLIIDSYTISVDNAQGEKAIFLFESEYKNGRLH